MTEYDLRLVVADVDVIIRADESHVGDLLNEVAAKVRERSRNGRGRPIGADLHVARIAQILAQTMGWRPGSREYRAAFRAAEAYCAGGHVADVAVILSRRADALRQGVRA
jgi:hypothetical protein